MLVTVLLDDVDAERGLEEGLHEGGQRKMHARDSRPEAVRVDARRLPVAADLEVAGMKLRDLLTSAIARVRSDETRMHAHIQERSAGAEDARAFLGDGREVIDIRVGEHRDDGVEMAIGEREGRGVFLHEVDLAADPLSRNAQLV
jgi:hypothetical protein